ncbi:KUP/HAK/KT family potassium transporter [Kitasatospora sp. NPDC048239]|uniref:KUP/HAK/KT family potassium transporter n=1 Tax=Kitasatospora sp. NPDC048239 TaxID=3364046 RepID=UPI003724974D
MARRPSAQDTARLALVIGTLGVVFGDIGTSPAISVLSAMEGLKVVDSSLEEAVVPGTAAIIVLLFLVQRRGTAAVGRVLGPVMIAWFVAIGACGAAGIADHPEILRALLPSDGAGFLFGHFGTAFFALAAVVLAATGAEAWV